MLILFLMEEMQVFVALSLFLIPWGSDYLTIVISAILFQTVGVHGDNCFKPIMFRINNTLKGYLGSCPQ
jgi:hypothetical protein